MEACLGGASCAVDKNDPCLGFEGDRVSVAELAGAKFRIKPMNNKEAHENGYAKTRRTEEAGVFRAVVFRA
jgi:hypothetical protein